MNIASTFSRYRVLVNTLALALALIAWAYAPPPASANAVWCQNMGCVEWSAENGCTATMYCCVFDTKGTDNGVMCWQNGELVQ